MYEEDDLNEFESALRTLRPLPGEVDPVAAAFEAGRRGGRRAVRRWQGAAAVALMLGLAVRLPRLREPPPPEMPQQPLARWSEPATPARSDQSLQFLEQTVHERGVDALPHVQLPALGALGVNDIL